MVASITGTIFSDLDFDEVQDSQEAGLENFEVQLLDSSGSITATTTTDASGFYEFLNLDSDPYSEGLTFADLFFAGNIILVDDTKEILATVAGVDTTTLAASDFIGF